MEKSKNNALKQALGRRMGDGLSSNFSYQTMNRIRLAAAGRHRRYKIISWCWLAAGSLFMLGLGVQIPAFYPEFNIREYMPQVENPQLTIELIAFYGYIAVPVLILLVLDHWMRWHRGKTMSK
ncbi:MAG: hypothetical protein LBU44_00120 [Mediterranea sp.]|jgi:hypothetical protein|nr:hypothetical protein [Mediterranea sp.]